jgi:hypothetical protein
MIRRPTTLASMYWAGSIRSDIRPLWAMTSTFPARNPLNIRLRTCANCGETDFSNMLSAGRPHLWDEILCGVNTPIAPALLSNLQLGEVETFSTTESQCLVPHFRGDIGVAVAREHCFQHRVPLRMLRGSRGSLRSRCQSDSRARRRIRAGTGAHAHRQGAPARHGFPPRRRRNAAGSLRHERLRRTVSLLGDHSGVCAIATGLRYPESDFTAGA